MRVDPNRVSELPSEPLALLLSLGGDTRVQIDPKTGQSQYGCSAVPRPDAVSLASSTASTISDRAYAAAEATRQTLRSRAATLGLNRAAENLAAQMDRELRTLLLLDDRVADIVYSASGTDSQLHAYVLMSLLFGQPPVSVLPAADETGGGVPYAVSGRHFNALTSQGVAVRTGAPLDGLGASPQCIQIPCRDNAGNVQSASKMDADVFAAVSDVIAKGGKALLHLMDHSKLGSRCPSVECVDVIRARWGDSVHVVVDACQARLSRNRIRSYLANGFLVVITGSKFFAGPAFSGALLVPAALAGRLSRLEIVPRGLRLYAWAGHWPAHWRGVRAALSDRVNVGALLRWAAAIEEIRSYFEVPSMFRTLALRRFAEIVPRLIEQRENLHLLPEYRRSLRDDINDEEMKYRTIFSFLIGKAGRFANVAECRDIYDRLTKNLTEMLSCSTLRGRHLASLSCHIGQPVAVQMPAIGQVGALRISADARFVYRSWSPAGDTASSNRLGEQFERVARVLDKLQLITGV